MFGSHTRFSFFVLRLSAVRFVWRRRDPVGEPLGATFSLTLYNLSAFCCLPAAAPLTLVLLQRSRCLRTPLQRRCCSVFCFFFSFVLVFSTSSSARSPPLPFSICHYTHIIYGATIYFYLAFHCCGCHLHALVPQPPPPPPTPPPQQFVWHLWTPHSAAQRLSL